MTVSVIVATYNRPDALELCLKSLMEQSRLPDEIVVGDDGSGAETKDVIERMSRISPVKIIHVWQFVCLQRCNCEQKTFDISQKF